MNLSDYKEYLNLSYDQFIAQLKIQSNQVHESLQYEKITDVVRVDLGDNKFVFFKDGVLKMIYISNDALADKLWKEFKNATKESAPERTVRSRAGKTSNQEIFSAQGITASIARDEVDFIEIYPPCSLQDYLDKIYREPHKFIR
jgi:hypothetical protein